MVIGGVASGARSGPRSNILPRTAMHAKTAHFHAVPRAPTPMRSSWSRRWRTLQ